MATACLQLATTTFGLFSFKQKNKQGSVRAIHFAKLCTNQGPGKAINYCDLKSSNSEPGPCKPEQMPCLNQHHSPSRLQVPLCLSRLLCFQCLAGKSKQTVSGVHPCFSNHKRVSIWCAVISYIFVSKFGISLCITPTLAADGVPPHNVPLCPDWTEQDLHKGFPTSENTCKDK